MINNIITEAVVKAVGSLYDTSIKGEEVQLQKTRKEFEGDITLVVFPFTRIARKKPEQAGEEIGKFLLEHVAEITAYNVIKGFLNLTIGDNYWKRFLSDHFEVAHFGFAEERSGKPMVVEFSSPNTNKPLHLGHVRNNLLGYSVSRIMEAAGYNVVRVNLVNDRGIHICKTMLAWQMWGNGITPEIAGKKGDKLVGDYYVQFDKQNKLEIKKQMLEGIPEDEAANNSPLMAEAREMLKKWESGDPVVRSLWEKMNSWVYQGFDLTYKRMGIEFDKVYYESETYLLGRELVLEGLDNGILFKKDDGSVWADLSDEGLDEKLLLRADGTSVYITQDIGTAQLRYDDYQPAKLYYVVGNEQNYHFDVLKLVLKKLGRSWAENIVHISYGMVELPEGKMKSREGTVVDADDLMDEMHATAKQTTTDLGKIEGFTGQEAEQLFEMIGQGALKYFILKVDPKKNMLFNPQESIQFDGNTGPFIQYTHARIKSLLRKAEERGFKSPYGIESTTSELLPREKSILKFLHEYPSVIQQAAETYSPALVANYIYDLVKEYNGFYQDTPVLREEDESKVYSRLAMSYFTAGVIKSGMGLLGIEVPERM